VGSSSAINAHQNLVILSQANPKVRSSDPFSATTKKNGKSSLATHE